MQVWWRESLSLGGWLSGSMQKFCLSTRKYHWAGVYTVYRYYDYDMDSIFVFFCDRGWLKGCRIIYFWFISATSFLRSASKFQKVERKSITYGHPPQIIHSSVLYTGEYEAPSIYLKESAPSESGFLWQSDSCTIRIQYLGLTIHSKTRSASPGSLPLAPLSRHQAGASCYPFATRTPAWTTTGGCEVRGTAFPAEKDGDFQQLVTSWKPSILETS